MDAEGPAAEGPEAIGPESGGWEAGGWEAGGSEAEARQRGGEARAESRVIRAMLELVPLCWLALVLFAFACLALYVPVRSTDQVPAVLAADRAVLPLLALLMVVAIIRYFSLRKSSSVDQAASSAVPSEGRDSL